MSFAAEPYGAFVDDLVSSLTGGETRERFVFLAENEPYQLARSGDVLAGTVRIRGIAGEAFRTFRPGADFEIDDGTIVWRADPAGVPAADAVWPDRGTPYWASYETVPDPQDPPSLTDRNPGSVTRTLAESFAREFAVLSLQLDAVHKAAFIETATGRDLDNVASLVGIARRSQQFASGEVVFSRRSPAPADIFVPEGSLISTSDVPAVTVETTEARTLRSGTLSVGAPVRAVTAGPGGVATADTLSVLHRPVLGISSVTNSEPLTFGAAETDAALRRRAARALETGGRSTVGAIVGALASMNAIRQQDVLVVEDHLGFPGVIQLTVAADLTPDEAVRAAELIEEHRPAGVRVLHNLPVVNESGVMVSDGAGGGGVEGVPVPVGPADIELNRFPVGVVAGVTAASGTLTVVEKQVLLAEISARITEQVDSVGIGEPVIYNRVVAAVMAVEGVYDVELDLFQVTDPPVTTGKANLRPNPPDLRAGLASLDLSIRGALVALDLTVTVQRIGLAAGGVAAEELARARDEMTALLALSLPALTGSLTQGVLLNLLPDTDDYEVDAAGYTAEFLDEGLRIQEANRTIALAPDQALWLRSLKVVEEQLST